MATKKLKNLLTTASVLAVVAGAGSALATNYYGAGGEADLAGPGNIFRADGSALGGAVVAGAHKVTLTTKHGVNLNVANPANVYTVDLDGITGQTIKVGANLTGGLAIENTDARATVAADADAGVVAGGGRAALQAALGGVGNPGIAGGDAYSAAAKAKLLFTAAEDVKLTGANTLGLINEINYQNKNNTVKISADGNLAAQLKNAGGNQGKLEIDADVTLKAGAGANDVIDSVTVNDGKTFVLDTDLATNAAAGLTVGGGALATATINTGKTFTGAVVLNNNAVLNLAGTVAGTINGDAANHGILNVTDDVTTGGTIGAGGNRLAAVNIAAGKTFTVKHDVTATATTLAAGATNLAVNADARDVNYNGGNLALGNTQTVTVTNAGGNTATLTADVTLNGTDATLTLDGTATDKAVVTGAITVTKGKLAVAAGKAGQTGAVTVAQNGEVDVNTGTLKSDVTVAHKDAKFGLANGGTLDGTLTFTSADAYTRAFEGGTVTGNVDFQGAGKKELTFKTNKTTFSADFKVAGNGSTVVVDGVELDNTNALELTGTGASVTLQNANAKMKAIKLSGDGAKAVVNTGTETDAIELAHANAAVELARKVNAITATAANNGKVTVTGNSEVNTNIGAGGNEVKELAFAGDHTLKIGAASNLKTITTAAGDNTGTIETADNLTVETIGAKGAALKLIKLTGNNKILTVTGDSFFTGVAGNYAAGGAANAGNLVFGGSFENNQQFETLRKITAGAAGKKVALTGGFKDVAEFEMDAGEVTLGDATGLHQITTTAAGGKLTLVNTNAVEIKAGTGALAGLNGKIANGNALASLTLKGADVKAGDTKTAELAFVGSDATFETTTLDNITKVTTDTAGKGRVVVTENSTLGDDFGAKGKELRNLHVKGVKTLNLNGKNVFAPITAEKADELTVTQTAGADLTIGAIGTKDARAKLLTLDATGHTLTVGDAVFAKDVRATSLVAGKVVFTTNVTGDLTATDAATNVTFNDGVNVTGAIKAGAANAGNFTFAGSHEVGAIGDSKTAVKSVAFTGTGKTVALTGNIYAEAAADSVTFGANTYNLSKDLTVQGKATLTDATLNVNKSTLTFTEQAKLAGTITLGVDLNTATGGVDLASATAADVAGLTGFKVVNTGTDLVTGDVGIIHGKDVGKLKGGVVYKGNFQTLTLAGDGADVLYVTGTLDGSGLVEKVSKNAGFVGNGKVVVSAIADKISKIPAGSDARKIANVIDRLSDAEVSELGGGLTPAKTQVAAEQAATAAADAVTTAIDTTNEFSTVAAAAGEETGRQVGMWVSGFGNKSTQKMRKGNAGYKGQVVGGSIGVDTLVADGTLLGLAGTYADVELKHKDYKNGDKTTSKNFLFSVYGRHELNDSMFVQGVATLGNGKVTNKEKRVEGVGVRHTATGKFDSMTYSLEALAGYNVKVADNVSLTPMAGVRYARFNDSGYTEKGTDFSNQLVAKRATDKVVGILGAKVQTHADFAGMQVTPELHARVEHDFRGKAGQVTTKIDGLDPIAITGVKAAKTMYNVGTSVMAKADMFEYGIGYDARMANKFVSHQGSLKVKVNL